ncbi:MAG: hypothetical protein ACKVOH_06400 [Chlamydiales bacterium]
MFIESVGHTVGYAALRDMHEKAVTSQQDHDWDKVQRLFTLALRSCTLQELQRMKEQAQEMGRGPFPNELATLVTLKQQGETDLDLTMGELTDVDSR